MKLITIKTSFLIGLISFLLAIACDDKKADNNEDQPKITPPQIKSPTPNTKNGNNNNHNSNQNIPPKPATKTASLNVLESLPKLQGSNLGKMGVYMSPKASPKISPKISPKASPKLTSEELIEISVGKPISPLLLDMLEGEECISTFNHGIFTFALLAACMTTRVFREVTYGSDFGDYNGDGQVNCQDYDDFPGQAELFHRLFCTEAYRTKEKIVEIGFAPIEEVNRNVHSVELNYSLVSFKAFEDNSSIVGFFNAFEPQVYPMNLRLWMAQKEEGIAAAKPIFAISSPELTSGVSYSFGLDSLEDARIISEIRSIDSYEGCRESPSTTTCNFQDFKAFFGNGPIFIERIKEKVKVRLPNTSHFLIWSDYGLAPGLVILEGSMLFDKSNTEGFFLDFEIEGDNSMDLTSTQKVYFQFVLLEDEMWRSMILFDSKGERVSIPVKINNEVIDYQPIYESGQCINVVDESKDCVKLKDITTYSSLFMGESQFDHVPLSGLEININFDDKPTKLEKVTLP